MRDSARGGTPTRCITMQGVGGDRSKVPWLPTGEIAGPDLRAHRPPFFSGGTHEYAVGGRP